MDELERRVLERVLAFCQEKKMIGAYRVDNDSVQMVVDLDYRSLTLHQTLRYLLALLEEAELADQFYETISK